MKIFSKNSVIELEDLHVMGILNVTPDSFFDGGKHCSVSNAIEHTNIMVNAGATIIDVGGESTRPGAHDTKVEEELSRVIPVIEAIAKRFKIWISVNTSKSEVIRESARVGAHIINDIRSLTDPGAMSVVAELGLPVCLMHMQGNPKTMQNKPKYYDILADVNRFFVEKIKLFELAGIKKENILLDPGFGFGKDLIHNYTLLANLSKFQHFGLPLLVGISRKSMVGKLLHVGPKECLIGSLACAVIAAMQGAHVIRVHDVKETVEAIRIVKATMLAKKESIQRYE